MKNTKAKGKFIACPEKTCKYTRPSKAATRTTRNSFRLTGIRAGVTGVAAPSTPALSEYVLIRKNFAERRTIGFTPPDLAIPLFIQRITYITGEISRESAFRGPFFRH